SDTPRPEAIFSSTTAVGLLSPRSTSEIIERLTSLLAASASSVIPRSVRSVRTRPAMRALMSRDGWTAAPSRIMDTLSRIVDRSVNPSVVGNDRDMSGSPGATRVVFIFARFHARRGHELAVAEALRDVVAPSSEEPGCLGIHAFRSIRDPLLFYIHSRWNDEGGSGAQAGTPHRVRCVERGKSLIDHPLEVTRAEQID